MMAKEDLKAWTFWGPFSYVRSTIFGVETSGAFADEWRPRPRPRPRSVTTSFSVDQKTGCLLFWETRSMRPWCVNGSYQKLKEWWWLDTENPLKQKHHAKKIPSWEFNIYPFAKVWFESMISRFSCLVGPMFPRTLEGKTRFLSWNQRPAGSCFCQSSGGAGMLGVVILPKFTTEMDHFMLEHHLWMVLQGLEPCFFKSLLGRKLQWMVGWCVLRCLLFGYCSLAFVLFLSWILHVKMFLCWNAFVNHPVFLSWLGKHHLFFQHSNAVYLNR